MTVSQEAILETALVSAERRIEELLNENESLKKQIDLIQEANLIVMKQLIQVLSR